MTYMSAFEKIQGLEFLGDAMPFVGHIHEIIETIQLFEDFERSEIETLAGYMVCFRVPSGSEIIEEAEHGDFMMLLLDGNVEIVKKDLSGVGQVIGGAGPGKTLGEMSLIDGEPRFASCVALTQVEIALLNREGFSRILTEQPAVGIKLMTELLMLLNQRLRSVSSQLMDCLNARKLRIR